MTQALATFDPSEIELIKRTISSNSQRPIETGELNLFLSVCRLTGLNPLLREVYGIKDRDGKFSIWTGIDGIRRAAGNTGLYAGQVGPLFCGDDGEWTDSWLKPGPPVACKVGVYGHGDREPTWMVIKYSEFAKDTPTWKKMPTHMMAIRAEFHALKKRFPRECQMIRLQEPEAADEQLSGARSEVVTPDQHALPEAQYTEQAPTDTEAGGGAPQVESAEEHPAQPPASSVATPPPADTLQLNPRDRALNLYRSAKALGLSVERPILPEKATAAEKDAVYAEWIAIWQPIHDGVLAEKNGQQATADEGFAE